MGVATTRVSNDLGSPNLTQNLAHWMDVLGQPLFLNHGFKIFLNQSPKHPCNQSSIRYWLDPNPLLEFRPAFVDNISYTLVRYFSL